MKLPLACQYWIDVPITAVWAVMVIPVTILREIFGKKELDLIQTLKKQARKEWYDKWWG